MIRQLTNHADKLTALSGLAQVAMNSLSVPPDYYLAGLWRFDLAKGLLWRAIGRLDHRRDTTYQVSSWSWASIDGKVTYFTALQQFYFESQIEIIEAECTSASPLDPTGRVTAGHMLLKGLMVPISLPKKYSQWFCPEDLTTIFLHFNTREGRVKGVRIPGSEDLKCRILMDERWKIWQSDVSYYCLRIGISRGIGEGRKCRGRTWFRLWFSVLKLNNLITNSKSWNWLSNA